MFTLEFGLSRIGVIGVTLIGVLSGYAAVETPFHSLFTQYVRVDPSQINEAEKKMTMINEEIERKRDRLVRLGEESILNQQLNNHTNIIRRLYNSVSNAWGSNEADSKLRYTLIDLGLMLEITALDEAAQQSSLVLDNMNYNYKRYLESKSSLGFLRQYFDKILGLFCLYKIGAALFNILFYRQSNADPVSIMAGFLVHFLNYQFDTQFWSMQFSFWTIGMLALSSVRNFLRRLMRYLTAFAPFDSAEASVLAISYVTGIYFTSSVLMLRNSMPDTYGSIIADLLPGMHFNFFTSWFDIIFLLSSGLSGIFLYLRLGSHVI